MWYHLGEVNFSTFLRAYLHISFRYSELFGKLFPLETMGKSVSFGRTLVRSLKHIFFCYRSFCIYFFRFVPRIALPRKWAGWCIQCATLPHIDKITIICVDVFECRSRFSFFSTKSVYEKSEQITSQWLMQSTKSNRVKSNNGAIVCQLHNLHLHRPKLQTKSVFVLPKRTHDCSLRIILPAKYILILCARNKAAERVARKRNVRKNYAKRLRHAIQMEHMKKKKRRTQPTGRNIFITAESSVQHSKHIKYLRSR